MASSLSIPIIRITDKTGKPRIVLEFGKSRKKKIEESLSKIGAIALGRQTRQLEIANWMYSSSVDHPTDFGRKYDFDVRGLIEQGWREENGD